MSFANQVVVVTGASSGIGWELAKTLAARQCAVGVIARRQDKLEVLVKEIVAAGGKASWAIADISDRQQTLAAFRSVRDVLGPVDLLIANAGYGVPTTLDPINADEIDATFKINTMGVIYAIEAVLPEMLQRRQGHLAAVSSLASYLGMPGESAYCASKAAVNVYMEGLRVQLRRRGIHVTTVCPGFIHTPMTAHNTFRMPFVMHADRAAQLIVRAIERKKKVYNFPWQTAFLMKLARWLPDRILARVFAGKAGVRLENK
jgi:short-subunit dehydrogenase